MTEPFAITEFAEMKRRGDKIVMVTAYDTPGARFADESGLDGGVDAAYEEATRLLPVGRPGEPREVAEAIDWLLSPAASFVNGAVLTIDGGATAVDTGGAAFNFRLEPRDGAADRGR